VSGCDTWLGVSEVDLDDRTSYQGLDSEGMLDFAVDFPAQVERAAEIGQGFVSSSRLTLRSPRQVVLAGMGGSGVGGEFLARLCEPRASVPILVCRNYEIPAFVDPDTLFIACSHSGDTEETLAAAAAARRRGACVLCITTDGRLKHFARRHGIELLEIPRTDPPMPPRAALGYLLVPLLWVLGSVGLYADAAGEIEEAVPLLERLRERVGPRVPTARNQAKRLANQLVGKIPWIQGTVGLMSVAAYRWRCQFNENSKTLAYSSEYPELNHNEVVGWELAKRLGLGVEVVVLRRPGDHWRNRARVDITRKLLKGKAKVHMVEAQGRSPLAQLLWTVYLGDFTSLYLAFLNGVNPAATDAIIVLKKELAGLQSPQE